MKAGIRLIGDIKGHKHDLTLLVDEFVNAMRDNDQVVNPGYRQAAHYGIVEKFIGIMWEKFLEIGITGIAIDGGEDSGKYYQSIDFIAEEMQKKGIADQNENITDTIRTGSQES